MWVTLLRLEQASNPNTNASASAFLLLIRMTAAAQLRGDNLFVYFIYQSITF